MRFFCEHAEAVVFLSATPVQLRSEELYTLLRLLRPAVRLRPKLRKVKLRTCLNIGHFEVPALTIYSDGTIGSVEICVHDSTLSNRGHQRRATFREPADYENFLERLWEFPSRFGFGVAAKPGGLPCVNLCADLLI